MNLPLFTDSEACHLRRDRVDGLVCTTCRSSLHFRRSLLVAYTLPDDDVQFECPHGVPWPPGAPGVARPVGRRVRGNQRVSSGRTPPTAQEVERAKRVNAERKAAQEKSILAGLTDQERLLVDQRAPICRACDQCCGRVFAATARCRLEGCGGVRLSVAGFDCKRGKW